MKTILLTLSAIFGAAIALLLIALATPDRPALAPCPAIEYRTNTIIQVDTNQAELAYLVGFEKGFKLCQDIRAGKFETKEAAAAHYRQEKQEYFDGLKK